MAADVRTDRRKVPVPDLQNKVKIGRNSGVFMYFCRR